MLGVGGVRPGEGQKTLLMFLTVLLVIAGYTMTKAVRDAVFLSEYGITQLSYMMIAIAIVAGMVISLFTRVTQTVPRNVLIFGTNAVIALSLIALALALRAHWSFAASLLYFWSGLFGLLIVAEFWLLANDLFNPREAKRLFPIIGAGAILGGIVGGALSSWLARPLGSTNLLYIVAVELVLAAVFANFAWRHRRTDLPQAVPTKVPLTQSLASVTRHPYVRWIALMMVCMTVCMTLVQWQYKGIAKAHFGSHRDEMTVFFGFMAAVLNIGSFTLQLLGTPRLLRRFGIGLGLRVLPGGFALGALALIGSAVFAFPALAMAAAAELLSDGFRFSIDKASSELLYLPIPREVKNRTKPFIDTVVDRFAGGLAGFIWLFLTWSMHVDRPERIPYASFVTLGVVLVWLWVIARARAGYIDAYRSVLGCEPAHPVRTRSRASAAFRAAFDALAVADAPERTRILSHLARREPVHVAIGEIEPHLERELEFGGRLMAALEIEQMEARRRPILAQAIRARLDDAVDRIATLLSLHHDFCEITTAFGVLRRGSSGERAGALELLDNLIDCECKPELVELLDRYVLGFSQPRITREQALQGLLTVDDPALRACAAWTARRSGLLAREVARLAKRDPHPVVRRAAGTDLQFVEAETLFAS